MRDWAKAAPDIAGIIAVTVVVLVAAWFFYSHDQDEDRLCFELAQDGATVEVLKELGCG